MAAVMKAAAPVQVDAVGAMRLQMHELAAQARLGASLDDLALGLRRAHGEALMRVAAARGAGLQRTAGAFVAGVCGLARWLDPRRSAQVVPPLCVVLWHVGRSVGAPDPATLWLDFVLPDDGRRAAGTEWAHDVRLLLMQASVPHRAETLLIAGTPAPTDAACDSAAVVRAWGCMSLFGRYPRTSGGRRGALR